MDGKSFLFTGKLTKFTRDDAKEMVEQNAGKTISGVSKKLDYLVVGKKPGSKLKIANELKIKVLTEKDFIKLVN